MEQSIEDMIESANLSEKFNEVLNDLKRANSYDPLNDGQYKNLVHLLGDDQQESNEDVEMLQTDFVIPNDPFSRMEIVNPVRNKNCNHLYDKEQFLKIFETRPRNRFDRFLCECTFFLLISIYFFVIHSAIKCPYTGCANKKVSIDDVEDDPRMKILIDNAKRQQS